MRRPKGSVASAPRGLEDRSQTAVTWSDLLRASDGETSLLEVAIKLVSAALLGGVLGYDREVKDRPAGLRTHMLTALAAATFTVLTFEIADLAGRMEPRQSADPIRVIEAVTAGVAFLAAGAIIRTGGQIQGLTTGAGMWMAGAIGIACGAGRLLLALLGTAIAAAILVALHWIEPIIGGKNGTTSDEASGTDNRP
ncbi:MAG: MgtC/SapB family protein [Hyphomicrobiaceae bacterium]|nr:MgtC/SapB family protein [Hyphomicrobiaceae bacterium]